MAVWCLLGLGSISAAPQVHADVERALTDAPAHEDPQSSPASTPEQSGESGSAAAPTRSTFELVVDKAQALAAAPYQPPRSDDMPAALRDLDYSQYRDIRFDADSALWKDEALFHVEFFHRGFVYREAVTIHEVVDGVPTTIPYAANQFDLGTNPKLEGLADSTLGFAGFRIHYPLNSTAYRDEALLFQGASYFRMVGRGQGYGLSARGLAVDTALPKGEEFPRFTEFWLEKPQRQATTLTIHALLDSPSVTGAYAFEFLPRGDSILRVRLRLFARADIERLGVAPLTSMFLHGTNRVRHYDDFRPEVHDSDVLGIHTGAGEWITRPLTNPLRLQVSTFSDDGPRGFGLMQRERNFVAYMDTEAGYHRRPSFWIVPDRHWGNGAVQLVEIPTPDETNDNIVAYWMPAEKMRAGDERAFAYELHATGMDVSPRWLASVARTRIGDGNNPGIKNASRGLRQFVVDFEGGELGDMAADQPVEAALDASSGRVRDLSVLRLPDRHGWRVAFKLDPDKDTPSDMRLYLHLRGHRLSDTWTYIWDPRNF